MYMLDTNICIYVMNERDDDLPGLFEDATISAHQSLVSDAAAMMRRAVSINSTTHSARKSLRLNPWTIAFLFMGRPCEQEGSLRQTRFESLLSFLEPLDDVLTLKRTSAFG